MYVFVFLVNHIVRGRTNRYTERGREVWKPWSIILFHNLSYLVAYTLQDSRRVYEWSENSLSCGSVHTHSKTSEEFMSDPKIPYWRYTAQITKSWVWKFMDTRLRSMHLGLQIGGKLILCSMRSYANKLPGSDEFTVSGSFLDQKRYKSISMNCAPTLVWWLSRTRFAVLLNLLFLKYFQKLR